jgi:hypothetical protein
VFVFVYMPPKTRRSAKGSGKEAASESKKRKRDDDDAAAPAQQQQQPDPAKVKSLLAGTKTAFENILSQLVKRACGDDEGDRVRTQRLISALLPLMLKAQEGATICEALDARDNQALAQMVAKWAKEADECEAALTAAEEKGEEEERKATETTRLLGAAIGAALGLGGGGEEPAAKRRRVLQPADPDSATAKMFKSMGFQVFELAPAPAP